MKKTAVVYDEDFLKHDSPRNPEHSGRLRSIVDRLEKNGLFEEVQLFDAKPAGFKELCLTHPLEYVEKIKRLSENAGDSLIDVENDTYLNKYTFNSASKGVGGILRLCEAIMDGEIANGFNLSRPPGHHATKDQYMGFCFFATSGIAAHYLLDKNYAKKIAVIDFDVHHGNGTEDVCGDNSDILFVSTHQKGIYPLSGYLPRPGEARDNVINCPLPAETEFKEYMKLLEEFMVPAVERFKPDWIIVSAGYDAHWRDPLAGLAFSSLGFGKISEALVRLAEKTCGGKIIFNLEGGYDLEALANSVENSLLALMGRDDFTDDFGEKKGLYSPPDLDDLIKELKSLHNLD